MHMLSILWQFPGSRKGVVLVIALLGSGCAAKGELSGTVTYQGKPLPTGTITFLDVNNQAVGSSSITAGKYAVGKVPAGLVKIIVTTPPAPPSGGHKVPPGWKKALPEGMVIPEGKKGKKNKEGKEFAELEPPAHPASHVSVPDKYSYPDTSGLTYTVQPGTQQHDIDLK